MHTYGDNQPIDDIVGRWKAGPHQNAGVWMTEYGDLDQTGENALFFTLAFVNGKSIVEVGMNSRPEPVRLAVQKKDMSEDPQARPGAGYVTTDTLNCASVGVVPHRPRAGASHGWRVDVPPKAIFTVVADDPMSHGPNPTRDDTTS
jgi:hypothetical protein